MTPRYRWNMRRVLGERHGDPCQIVARLPSGLRVRVRFDDGHEVTVHRSAVLYDQALTEGREATETT